MTPELKQQDALTPGDFLRHPVWIGVHNYDHGEPWYDEGDELTFRPWLGPLPFREPRGIILAAADIHLADGSTYAGFCSPQRDDWDTPPPRRSRTSGELMPIPSWSERHGTKLSLLGLLSPTLFADGRQLYLALGVPQRRKQMVRAFYAALGKQPREVFPLRFAAHPNLADGISSGTLDGLYYFPLGGRPFEIDTGESLLTGGDEPLPAPPPLRHGPAIPGAKTAADLRPADFTQYPVWVRVPESFEYAPWTGALPIEPAEQSALIPATFTLRDGTEFPGHIQPIVENWLDVAPPGIKVGNQVLPNETPRELYQDSPYAIMAGHRPTMVIADRPFPFWDRQKASRELRAAFYQAIAKLPGEIFPIRFRADPNLATGLTFGQIEGFYNLGPYLAITLER